MHRFEALLAQLPADCVLDGEIVALDDEGRPRFYDHMSARPTWPLTSLLPTARTCARSRSENERQCWPGLLGTHVAGSRSRMAWPARDGGCSSL